MIQLYNLRCLFFSFFSSYFFFFNIFLILVNSGKDDDGVGGREGGSDGGGISAWEGKEGARDLTSLCIDQLNLKASILFLLPSSHPHSRSSTSSKILSVFSIVFFLFFKNFFVPHRISPPPPLHQPPHLLANFYQTPLHPPAKNSTFTYPIFVFFFFSLSVSISNYFFLFSSFLLSEQFFFFIFLLVIFMLVGERRDVIKLS